MAENIFPYELPENWQLVKLGTLTKNQYGYTAKATTNNSLPKMLRITDIQNGFVDWETVPNCEIDDELKEKYLLKNDDIVIARTGATTGKSYLVKSPSNSVFASYLIRLQVIKNVDVTYVYYFLQSNFYWFQISELSAGIAQPGVNSTKLKNILIPLPPLDEQKRIVAVIESLFEKLDAAKSIVQKVLDGYDLRRAAILHKAFTGDLTKNFRSEHGLTLDDWQEKKLGDVCQINPPKISTQNLSDDLDVSFFPMASLSEVEGKITKPQIKKLGEVKRGYTNFSEGDVVFAKITPCMENGKSAVIEKLVNDVGFGTTEFFVLRCSENILNKFLYHLIRGKKFRDEAKEVMAGAVGQLRVPKNFLTNYEINLPPLAEQKEIVRVLESLLEKEDRTKEIAEKILSEIDVMKRTILARAFRGELGTKYQKKFLEGL